MTPRNAVGIYLRGFCMGAADAVPGVSGGTIALISGIYDRLIAAVASADPRVLVDLVQIHDPEHRERAREGLLAMDLPFLLVLGTGVITAVVSVAQVIEIALHEYTALTFAFFFGLIAASAIVLADDVALDRPGGIAAGVAGVAIAFLLSGAGEGALPNALPFVLVAGAIGISAMVLPGISGSLILLLLGQYDYMLGRLNAFVESLADLANGGSVGAVVDPGVPVVTFLSGAVVGLLTVARVVEWALEVDRQVTITFLVGLMVGALRLPAIEVRTAADAWTPSFAGAVIVAAVVGAGIVLVFDYYTGVEY